MTDKKSFQIIFIITMLLLLAIWMMGIFHDGPSSAQIDLFFGRFDDFLADFTNTSGYCAFRSPYDNIAYADYIHKQYPPFAYIFFWLFSKFSWKMESYYAENNFLKMYQEPFFLFMLFFVFIL